MREPSNDLEKEVIDMCEDIITQEIISLDPLNTIASTGINTYASDIRDITLRIKEAKSFFVLSEIMYIVFAFNHGIEKAKPESKYMKAAASASEKIIRKHIM